MIELDAAAVLLQWAVGGLLFGWVTTRRREVGIGYGWTVRGTFGLMALAAFGIGRWNDPSLVRDLSALAVVITTAIATAQSWTRRKAGVSGQNALAERRTARVAAMTGIDRAAEEKDEGPEFDPRLDLLPPLVGVAGLVAAGIDAGDPAWLQVARMLVGAVFLGAISDGMLLGHWYLVQPGLPRAPLLELVRWTAIAWVPELILLLVPTGMISVLNGTIDDGYNGLLGWFWVTCAVFTIGLLGVTRAALNEKAYSAVMAATGLLYLAILTAFGMDLVARATLRA